MLTSTPFGKEIGMLRGQTSSTNYSPTWEKTLAKEVKEQVENGRRLVSLSDLENYTNKVIFVGLVKRERRD
ncbi:hypothetical protein PoB_004319300 [Plakobranchus ocellatus]|uniref:Uncharacterized protein n=1 Tax=Plakobranchus ocellatus TaxID=259542 RepID=A0AAV4BAU4_9GAST|nr:hypothetical protein PoB_004319300 [Plakobranchus ocellatus]